MTTVTYTIPNINCTHCVHTITSEISEIDGVKTVNANADTKVATIAFDAPATEELIVSTLKAINYPPQLS